MIKPTVGRIVLYNGNESDGISYGIEQNEVCPAVVTRVWSDTCVNLTIFGNNGGTFSKTSVTLKQGDEQLTAPYCEWMPYQKEQAAVKIEEVKQTK